MASHESVLRWIWRYLSPHRRSVSALAFLSAAEVALRVLSPWPLKLVIDQVLGSQPLPAWESAAMRLGDPLLAGIGSRREQLLIAVVVAGLGIQIAHQIVLMLHTRLSTAVGHRMVHHLREQLFGHLQALSLAEHSAISRGDCVHRVSTDAACLEQIVLRALFPIVFSILTLAAMFAVLLSVDVNLALVSLGVAPIIFVWLRFNTRRMQPIARRGKDIDAALVSYLQETVTSIVLVKTHARESFEQQRFARASTRALEVRLESAAQESLFGVVVGVLTVAGSSAVVLTGSLAVLRGELPLGTLLLVLSYLTFVYGPLCGIANTIGGLQQAIASAGRVRDTFALTPEPPAGTGEFAPARLIGAVAFHDVGFAYETSRPVLGSVTFAVEPGQMVALVGASGAGKSTLMSLIVRLWDVTAGRLSIDGVDIRRYDLRSLRNNVAVVTQDPMILSGTIRDNLRYGRLEATDAEIELAARAAHIHDVIADLPHGYDTWLGEGGTTLSGGQRQRLSIARAFVKDAPILILDEPTAALDTVSERLVVDGLRSLQQGRTTFVIAHRLSTVRSAERILVLDQGRIIAEGTHESLMRHSPFYIRLTDQLAPAREVA